MFYLVLAIFTLGLLVILVRRAFLGSNIHLPSSVEDGKDSGTAGTP